MEGWTEGWREGRTALRSQPEYRLGPGPAPLSALIIRWDEYTCRTLPDLLFSQQTTQASVCGELVP